jgi:hypothetical protein
MQDYASFPKSVRLCSLETPNPPFHAPTVPAAKGLLSLNFCPYNQSKIGAGQPISILAPASTVFPQP